MFLAVGVGAFGAGMFHLMTHAFFKALLFLGSGSVILALHHEQDLFRMGGLRKLPPADLLHDVDRRPSRSPGVPLLSGFFSKDEILCQAFSCRTAPLALGNRLMVAGMTAFYMFRLMFLAFHGEGGLAWMATGIAARQSSRTSTVPTRRP